MVYVGGDRSGRAEVQLVFGSGLERPIYAT